jgi:hypothetical protein
MKDREIPKEHSLVALAVLSTPVREQTYPNYVIRYYMITSKDLEPGGLMFMHDRLTVIEHWIRRGNRNKIPTPDFMRIIPRLVSVWI